MRTWEGAWGSHLVSVTERVVGEGGYAGFCLGHAAHSLTKQDPPLRLWGYTAPGAFSEEALSKWRAMGSKFLSSICSCP